MLVTTQPKLQSCHLFLFMTCHDSWDIFNDSVVSTFIDIFNEIELKERYELIHFQDITPTDIKRSKITGHTFSYRRGTKLKRE